jgi:hypothetical protein
MSIVSLLEQLALNTHYSPRIQDLMSEQSPELKNAFSNNSTAFVKTQISDQKYYPNHAMVVPLIQ